MCNLCHLMAAFMLKLIPSKLSEAWQWRVRTKNVACVVLLLNNYTGNAPNLTRSCVFLQTQTITFQQPPLSITEPPAPLPSVFCSSKRIPSKNKQNIQHTLQRVFFVHRLSSTKDSFVVNSTVMINTND